MQPIGYAVYISFARLIIILQNLICLIIAYNGGYLIGHIRCISFGKPQVIIYLFIYFCQQKQYLFS